MITRLLHLLRDDLFDSGLRGKLVRTTLTTGAIKFGSLGIAFIASLLYARALGPTEYGAYAYVLAWTALLTIPSTLGLPQYLLRESAKSPASWRRLLGWGDRRVLIAGAISAAAMAGIALLSDESDMPHLLLLAMPIPLLNALVSIRSGLLQGRGEVVASQWPNLLLAPALILASLSVIWLLSGRISATMLLLTTMIATLAPLAINSAQLKSASAFNADDICLPVKLGAALPFMWLNALFLINSRTDLIMVGALHGAHDAGIYSVAARAAELVPFFLTISNTAVGPKVSAMHHAGDKARLQRLATETARRLLWTTLPIAFVMVFGAPYMINLFYGTKFAEAATVLQVLALGQLCTVLGGPVGILLNMTEHAALSAKAFAVSALANIVLNALLVPRLGSVGAAISTATSLAGCTLLRWWAVRRYLDLRPSALGI
jgi:O-antigen/teichoic acid export membrane protein